MTPDEIRMLLQRMEAAWPNIFKENRDARLELFRDTFAPVGWNIAQKAINKLIDSSEVNRYLGPSVADLKIAFRKETPTLNQSQRTDGLTFEGKVPATPEQKRSAIIRGYKRFNPSASDSEITAHLNRCIGVLSV